MMPSDPGHLFVGSFLVSIFNFSIHDLFAPIFHFFLVQTGRLCLVSNFFISSELSIFWHIVLVVVSHDH